MEVLELYVRDRHCHPQALAIPNFPFYLHCRSMLAEADSVVKNLERTTMKSQRNGTSGNALVSPETERKEKRNGWRDDPLF